VKKWTSVILLLCCISASALERAELSPDAQKLIPENPGVIVHFKAGNVTRGFVVSRTDTNITLKMERKGGVSFQMAYPLENIERIEEIEICEYFARGLRRFTRSPNAALTSAQYARAIALFDEFLEVCAGHVSASDVRDAREEFAAEQENLDKGLDKFQGEWLSPVAAAIAKFRLANGRITKMEEKMPGIEKEGYKGSRKGKAYYDQLVKNRRDVAKELPRMVAARVPNLIRNRQFDEAVSEVTAFLRFWILQVIESEAGGDSSDVRAVFETMNFSYITGLEEQIMDAYQVVAAEMPAGVSTEAGMVYVPGRYFLMGNSAAGIDENTFPLRIIFVSPFLIDKYEVSNADYREFLAYVKSSGDFAMEHPDAPPLKDHTPQGWDSSALAGDMQPAIGVDWFDAYAFAKWKGKRLPTEAEWECAARGSDGREYLWGDEFSAAYVINDAAGRKYVAGEIDRINPPEVPKPKKKMFGKSEPLPPPPATKLPQVTWEVNHILPPQAWVDREFFKGLDNVLSPCGALHMVGNAAEWVNDWYDDHYYRSAPVKNPSGPAEGDVHVYRGGSYLSTEPEQLTTYWRGVPGEKEKDGLNSAGLPMIGLRCAKSVPGVLSP